MSYATVEDFCDSYDHINSLTTASEDLINVQRPWMLKSILGCVARGGRILMLSAGEPLVSDVLRRLGYQVWRLDILAEQFPAGLHTMPKHAFDCAFSLASSTLEQMTKVSEVVGRLNEILGVGGVSIHALSHIHKGREATEALSNLKLW